MSLTATRAPARLKARAIALPIPDPAPVTKARRPANRSCPAIPAPCFQYSSRRLQPGHPVRFPRQGFLAERQAFAFGFVGGPARAAHLYPAAVDPDRPAIVRGLVAIGPSLDDQFRHDAGPR